MTSEPKSDQSEQKNIQGQSEKTNSRQRRPLFSRVGRRSFLGQAGLFTATATGVVTGVIGSPLSAKKRKDIVQAQDIIGQISFDSASLSQKAYQVRVQAAQLELDFGVGPHPTNGDEERYPNKIATDTRILPHNSRGEVKLKAYNSLIKALTSLNPDDFENIILGGQRKLLNPQGPLAISLEGINAAQLTTPPPPTLDSTEQAGEAVEVYWQALLREVPLNKLQDDTDDPKVLAAVSDLNKLSAFTGPKQNDQVTP